MTDQCPKPLVPIFGKPLITFALDHLIALGVRSFVINTHHLAEQFEQAFEGHAYRDCPVRLIYEPDLLETGGGIKNAEQWIGSEPFIVYSGDILTDINLERLVEEHFQRKNDVTLALRHTGLAAGVALKDGRVEALRGQGAGCDFANVSVWNAPIFERISPGRKISFVPILADWIGQGGRIGGVLLDENQWFNIGSRREYLEVHRVIFEGQWRPSYVEDASWPEKAALSARIDGTARLSGFYAVGREAAVDEGAVIRDTVIWPGAKIASRANLEGCIVRVGQRAGGTQRAADI